MSSNNSRCSSVEEVKPSVKKQTAPGNPQVKKLARKSSFTLNKQSSFTLNKQQSKSSKSIASSKSRSQSCDSSKSPKIVIPEQAKSKKTKNVIYSGSSDSASICSADSVNLAKMGTKKIKKKLSDCSYASFSGSIEEEYHGEGIKLLNWKEEQDKNKEVVAMIVSFKKGSTYDALFTSVEQKSMEGTKVLVYACSSNFVEALTKGFKGEYQNDEVKGLFTNIAKLDPDCVVFNWECCSGYSNKSFPETASKLFEFLEIIVEKGHMAMFSDFSLKALIKEWPQNTKLGANPFKQCSETSGNFKMNFSADILRECPSAQLQTVGQMTENNTCNFHALGGTIVYGVKTPPHAVESPYVLQVLTVVEKKIESQYECQIGEHKGAAGHVLLAYKSGGCILTSMGHWIELMKLDTTEKKFFDIAKEEYGEEYALERKRSFEALSDDGRNSYIAKNTKKFVQNQAPCKNMERKRRNRVPSMASCTDSD